MMTTTETLARAVALAREAEAIRKRADRDSRTLMSIYLMIGKLPKNHPQIHDLETWGVDVSERIAVLLPLAEYCDQTALELLRRI